MNLEHVSANDSKAIRKLMLTFLLPVMLANILQSFSQIVSMFLVGRYIGVEALAAIAAFFPFFFFLLAFAIGIGSGSSILIGQTYGAKNEERMKQVIGVTLLFTTIISIGVAIFGAVFIEKILRFMDTPENIFDASVSYAKILFYTLPIMFLYMVYTTFLRGVGDSKTPFYFLVISVILNIAFLPPLLFGWFGLPAFGLDGAAYAFAGSSLITFVSLLIYLKRKNHALQFDRSVMQHLTLRKDMLGALLKLAIPASISMVAISMAEIAVIKFVNAYGSDATAAYGVVNQVASYVQIPAMSLSIAISVFVAQALGAGNTDLMEKVRKVGVQFNYVIGGGAVVIAYLFAVPILSFFVTDSETISIAHHYLLITFWSYIIFGHTLSVSATMRATGVVLWPTLFLIIAVWAIEVPVAYVLSTYTSLGLNGVWIAYPTAFVLNFIMQYFYFQYGWKRKKLTAMIHT